MRKAGKAAANPGIPQIEIASMLIQNINTALNYS